MKLYHGSPYKTSVLKPGFEHSGELVEWDQTESNRFLYASVDRDEAILNGLAAAISKHHLLDRIHWDRRIIEVTVSDHLTQEQVVRLKVYLYEFNSTDDWVKVGNQHNGSKTEYKTQSHVPVSEPTLIKDVLCSRKLFIHSNAAPKHLSW